jgi:5-methylthioadenosine/S-adenosylhomocysteine deaminase
VFAESGRAVETVFVDGRLVVRGGKLVTLDEAKLAAEAAELAPAFRREAKALAARSTDLTPPLLEANRRAWDVPLGFERYIGRTPT